MTVSATPVSTGTATAELSMVDGHYHLALGLPKGNTGATPRISAQVQTGAAGSEAAFAKRPVYDVLTLTGHKTAPLADAFGTAFEFVPCLADAEDEALACGLLFCTLADRALHLTAKR